MHGAQIKDGGPVMPGARRVGQVCGSTPIVIIHIGDNGIFTGTRIFDQIHGGIKGFPTGPDRERQGPRKLGKPSTTRMLESAVTRTAKRRAGGLA